MVFTPAGAPVEERRHVPEILPQPRMADPLPAPEPEPIVEPEPEPEVLVEAEPPVLDLDDLDTPAYLRQGRLLN